MKKEESGRLVKVEFHDDNDGSVTVVNVPEGTRITEAATKAAVYIPTLQVFAFTLPSKLDVIILIHF